MKMKHAIHRTSPKGGSFVGTCANCGRADLTFDDFRQDDCENVRGLTEEESIIEAIAPLPDPSDGPAVLHYCGDNAQRWAEVFCRTAKSLGHGDIDEGWMIGWFANAIEHSHDIRKRADR
jgi:hypothetical protein